ncbi:UNVERIFIED_CONTAM: hypothetical protein HDU68_012468 [Siphonaria sp. JEL0065]|nr:hypothetical protein HDU68_012468 [Siphonaria sp. JEL0065]
MKVNIVGSGAFGLPAALSLAKRGHSVTVFDRQPIPGDDSASNDITKVVRPDYGADALYMGGKGYQDLCIESIKQFRDLDQTSLKSAGKKIYYECGVVFAVKHKQWNQYEQDSFESLKNTSEYKDQLEVLDEAKVEKLLGKSFARQFPNGYINRRAGYADSGLTVIHFAELCKKAGVQFVVGDKAGLFIDYIVESSKRVTGIKTADGKLHYSDAVLVAAGSWTPSILPELKVLCEPAGMPVIHFKIPDTMKSQYEPANFPVWFADMGLTGFYGFPLTTSNELKFAFHGAGYSSSFHTSTRATAANPTTTITPRSIPRESIVMYRKFLGLFFPELNTLDVSRTRLCWYCDSWDGNFYIDAIPGRNGLFVATGGSGHAFKFMPVIGDIIADVIEGKPNHYQNALFKWRVPSEADRQRVDGLKMNYEKGAKVLENMVMADADDLKADEFNSGRLEKKEMELKSFKRDVKL